MPNALSEDQSLDSMGCTCEPEMSLVVRCLSWSRVLFVVRYLDALRRGRVSALQERISAPARLKLGYLVETTAAHSRGCGSDVGKRGEVWLLFDVISTRYPTISDLSIVVAKVGILQLKGPGSR